MTTTTKTSMVAGIALVIAFAMSTSAFAASIISEAEAISIAESAYTGGGEQTDAELENEDGATVWEVEFTESNGNEVDIVIDAESGDVLGSESDEDEDEDEDEYEEDEDESEEDEEIEEAEQAVLKAQAKVSQADALSAAKAAYTGSGTFNEMDLDDEDGGLIWEVEFVDAAGNEVEVHVDAMTGDVLGQIDDVEDDEDEDDDDDMDINDLRMKLLSVLQQLVALLNAQR